MCELHSQSRIPLKQVSGFRKRTIFHFYSTSYSRPLREVTKVQGFSKFHCSLLLIVHWHQCIKLKHCLSVTTTATVLQTTSTNIPKRTEFENVGKVMRNRDFGITFFVERQYWNEDPLDAGSVASRIFLLFVAGKISCFGRFGTFSFSLHWILHAPPEKIPLGRLRTVVFHENSLKLYFLRSPTGKHVSATRCHETRHVARKNSKISVQRRVTDFAKLRDTCRVSRKTSCFSYVAWSGNWGTNSHLPSPSSLIFYFLFTRQTFSHRKNAQNTSDQVIEFVRDDYEGWLS